MAPEPFSTSNKPTEAKSESLAVNTPRRPRPNWATPSRTGNADDRVADEEPGCELQALLMSHNASSSSLNLSSSPSFFPETPTYTEGASKEFVTVSSLLDASSPTGVADLTSFLTLMDDDADDRQVDEAELIAPPLTRNISHELVLEHLKQPLPLFQDQEDQEETSSSAGSSATSSSAGALEFELARLTLSSSPSATTLTPKTSSIFSKLEIPRPKDPVGRQLLFSEEAGEDDQASK